MNGEFSLSFGSDNLGRYLRRYIGQDLTLRTKSGDIIQGILRRVTTDGIVSILESAMVSPFMDELVTVLRIDDIESFSFNLPG
ncbi:hypothetical protein M3226_29730 [Neobacillus cucumis]|uniref:hypothetical protein n=1 Tax=Neobacillus cucumis TaxID=1740721 RepID=UPI0020422DEA|nr:hypothetical protein [Neobacillus cucumis]MCM3729739.1 hypothetical protein [Neobacillus cucumis]